MSTPRYQESSVAADCLDIAHLSLKSSPSDHVQQWIVEIGTSVAGSPPNKDAFAQSDLSQTGPMVLPTAADRVEMGTLGLAADIEPSPSDPVVAPMAADRPEMRTEIDGAADLEPSRFDPVIPPTTADRIYMASLVRPRPVPSVPSPPDPRPLTPETDIDTLKPPARKGPRRSSVIVIKED